MSTNPSPSTNSGTFQIGHVLLRLARPITLRQSIFECVGDLGDDRGSRSMGFCTPDIDAVATVALGGIESRVGRIQGRIDTLFRIQRCHTGGDG